MLLLESVIVIEPLAELLCQADDVPVVCDLLRPFFVQPEGSSPQLVDAHACCHRGQVNQDVDSAGIPTLSKQTSSPDDALGDAFLEEFGNHHRVISRLPMLTTPTDLHEAITFDVIEFDVKVALLYPLLKSW